MLSLRKWRFDCLVSHLHRPKSVVFEGLVIRFNEVWLLSFGEEEEEEEESFGEERVERECEVAK